jgi:hypothetical protein
VSWTAAELEELVRDAPALDAPTLREALYSLAAALVTERGGAGVAWVRALVLDERRWHRLARPGPDAAAVERGIRAICAGVEEEEER